jgi:hypothetical protein
MTCHGKILKWEAEAGSFDNLHSTDRPTVHQVKLASCFNELSLIGGGLYLLAYGMGAALLLDSAGDCGAGQRAKNVWKNALSSFQSIFPDWNVQPHYLFNFLGDAWAISGMSYRWVG